MAKWGAPRNLLVAAGYTLAFSGIAGHAVYQMATGHVTLYLVVQAGATAVMAIIGIAEVVASWRARRALAAASKADG